MRVIPSRSVPAGLAAIVRYLPSLSAEENEAAMLEALDQVVTGEVTVASRDVELDGVAVRKGAWLGLADGAAVASSADFDEVAWAVVEKLLGDGREVLTLLTGEDEPELDRLPAAPGGAASGRRARRPAGRAAALSASPLGRVVVWSRRGRPAPPIRVLLVEDNDVFRQALVLLLELQDGIEVAAAVSEGNAALSAYRQYRPDVVVMDFRLPGMDGVEVTLELVSEHPEVAVVCLTASASPRELDALMAAGAIDCLRKDEALDVIVAAIRRAGQARAAR